MKILHCCLAAFYIDGYSYQENILPREHKKMGHDVKIVASTETFVDNSKLGYIEPSEYINEDNISVVRLPYSKILPHAIMKKIRIYKGLNNVLCQFRPDILFLHDLQFMDILTIVKYLKDKPLVKVFVDCHSDFSNSARTWLSKNILHKIIYRYCAKKIEPYTEKFWGVLPARVNFLVDVYNIPREKVKLLVMGAEDEKVKNAQKYSTRHELRDKYGLKKEDILIVTAGKIDSAKKQTLILMRAVHGIKNERVKMVIFGSLSKEIQEEFYSSCDDEKIKFIGWVNSNESYNHFAMADLVVFPGRHSVFWEQVVGLGIPCIIKYWEGTTHIDLDGNCKYIFEDTVEEIRKQIEDVVNNEKELNNMKMVAIKKGMEAFSYSRIAMKSIR